MLLLNCDIVIFRSQFLRKQNKALDFGMLMTFCLFAVSWKRNHEWTHLSIHSKNAYFCLKVLSTTFWIFKVKHLLAFSKRSNSRKRNKHEAMAADILFLFFTIITLNFSLLVITITITYRCLAMSAESLRLNNWTRCPFIPQRRSSGMKTLSQQSITPAKVGKKNLCELGII